MNRGGNIQLLLTATNLTVQHTDGTALQSPDGRKPYEKTFPTNVAVSPVPSTVTYDALGRPNAGFIFSVGSQTIAVEQETGYAH